MTYHLHPRSLYSLANQKGAEFYDTFLTNDNPHLGEHRGQYQNQMMNWNKMRDMVLSGGYQKVWLVEDDTVVPEDALAKLLEVDADVVTGLYVSRHQPYGPNIHRKQDRPGLGAIYTWPELKEVWDQTIPCSGGATGCVLIDRKVLEEFTFVMDDYYAPDVPFMRYCWENNFRQMARLDVHCGHMKPNGDTLWPAKETGYRLEVYNGSGNAQPG